MLDVLTLKNIASAKKKSWYEPHLNQFFQNIEPNHMWEQGGKQYTNTISRYLRKLVQVNYEETLSFQVKIVLF